MDGIHFRAEEEIKYLALCMDTIISDKFFDKNLIELFKFSTSTWCNLRSNKRIIGGIAT